MIGLALLTGSGVGSLAQPIRIESRAARIAKAQFTLAPIVPPWRDGVKPLPLPAAVGAIRRMESIIDLVRNTSSLPADVASAFTTYKALDRLRMLAEWASRTTTSTAERLQLQNSFAKGVADLQRFLSDAPSDRLTLAFQEPARRADSIPLAALPGLEIVGRAVTKDRAAAIPGLVGDETFTLTLTRSGTSDTVRVDLATLPQPPTLDRLATAFTSAIAAIPMRDLNGNPALDPEGNVRPRWGTRFAVTKGTGGWGLELRTTGTEQVDLRQPAAGDALMVAAGQSAAGSRTGTGLIRFDLPVGSLARNTLGTLIGTDRAATEAARLLPDGAKASIAAAVSGRAMISDRGGFTYFLGTASGDFAGQRSDGADDLLLTKLDSDGAVVWQRGLGSGGSADGAALAIAANGDILVAGTATGDLDGTTSDGDLMVARFTVAGEEKFATLVRAIGADQASAVAEAADGSIVIGGRAANGDGLLARLNSVGQLVERRTLAGEAVRALAAEPGGTLAAVTAGSGGVMLRRFGALLSADTGSVSVGDWDARSLAIATDGRLAVGGQIATAANGRDARAMIFDNSLNLVATAALSTAADDRLDSLIWLGGSLYAGGRTAGLLGAARSGDVDGFVARIDPSDGSLGSVSQWGRAGTKIDRVDVAAAPGADSATSALGFRSGILNPPDSGLLVDQTSLRPGDRFSFRTEGGKPTEMVIGKTDTLASLAERMGRLAGRTVTVRTARGDNGLQLKIEPRPGQSLELISGPDGRDALAKLGLQATRLIALPPFDKSAPRVKPGGHYGLGLSPALSVATTEMARISLTRVSDAISSAKAGFRSLYWDETKAALADSGSSRGRVSPYESAQLGRYRDALTRLGGNLVNGGF